MFRKLIVNMAEHETRVALLEDGTIVELFIHRQDESDIAGNIYKGRVQRVLPGMQAAFIDIGLNQAAFIYVGDVLGEPLEEMDVLLADDELDREGRREEILGAAEGDEETPWIDSPPRPGIEDLLTEGQDLLVHVAKSPIGTKGARVTCHVSLPGRFLVMMPNSKHIGVSRKIEEESERVRLKQVISELRSSECGYIARTAAEGIQAEVMASEMAFLDRLWQSIKKKHAHSPSPALLHKELNVSLRAVRDLLTQEADKVVIDSRSGYEQVLGFLETCAPGLKKSVELYEGSEPIFDAFHLEGDISRALKKKVWLKSGGYIVIEQTEALCAIDVNTGRYVGKHNLEETIFKTNLEAVKEIAYQVRLRDIGGIIVIDFIDMEKKSHQEKVFNAFKEAVHKDRSKTHILPISELGLIQMTRKRIRKSLTNTLCEPCFYCEGEGYLISRKSICYDVYREILREAQDMVGERLMLRVNPEIADRLHGEENYLLTSLERRLEKQIVIYPNPQFHVEQFDVFEIVSKPARRSGDELEAEGKDS
jgi:ribonuclease G